MFKHPFKHNNLYPCTNYQVWPETEQNITACTIRRTGKCYWKNKKNIAKGTGRKGGNTSKNTWKGRG